MATAINHVAMQTVMIRKVRQKISVLGFRSLVWFLCLLLLCPPQMVLAADPVPSGATNTTVTPAGNGVPVVNIATPNGSGLSHNAFTSYNVDPHGLVLNNGDMSEAYRQSLLAGQIAANPNLAAGNQASIILNEVTGNSRTFLNGFTEVLGGKADVIIANPFGITSSGGGFINTDRVSLVTGTPNITDGALNYFKVSGGDILITGTGVNASAQRMLDLVSRKISVDGQVNAQNLNVVAGAFNWNRETGPTVRITSDYNPEWAIDSSALGGMYAGRIALTGYGAGIGVRVHGEAAATADDFTISTSGLIEIGGKLSANQDLSVTSSSARTDAIKITDANLSAGRNVGINANNGGAILTGGGIVAGGDLSYGLGKLTDSASATAGIADANKRYGNTVNLTGLNPGWLDPGLSAWNMDGVYYGANSALAMNVYSLDTGSASAQTSLNSGGSMAITSIDGDLLFGNAALRSVGDMALQNEYGDLRFGAGSGQGVQSTAGNISLVSSDRSSVFVNNGIITADSGDVIIRVTERLDNSGNIHASGLLDIQGSASLATFVNDTGSLLGGSVGMQDIFRLSVADGGSLESVGDMNVTASILNIGAAADASSRILAATSGTGAGVFSLSEKFTNYGVLHSGYDLNVDVASLTLNNMSTGGISAAHDLFLNARADMTNYGAMYAGNNLSASASNSYNIGANSDEVGTIGAGNDITIAAAGSFINSGYIDAQRDITVTASRIYNRVNVGNRMWGDTTAPVETYTGGNVYFCGVNTCIDSYFTLTWTQDETFVGGIPDYTPRIVGGSDGTVTVKGFDYGVNQGGAISGNTLNLYGNAGSTFDNTDLMTATRTFIQHRTQTVRGSGDPVITDAPATCLPGLSKSARRSYIRGNNITMTGLALTSTSSATSSSTSTANPVSLTATGTPFSGLSLSLPSNPNGMFVTAIKPSANYLVETNPLYTDIENFLGSDYLLSKYEFKSDEIIKRLGDAGYETYLVAQQLITQTGGKLLPKYSNEKEQMQGLMDNAASQAKLLGLEMGTELTEDQQALLKEDMLWMVETVVNGQKVLAPVVYIAASTKRMFASTGGASISGTNVNLELTSLSNTGGTISGSKTLNVTTSGNIANISGTISGGEVSIKSTGGSIVNKTVAETGESETSTSTAIGKTAKIVAKGDLQLDAAKNITNLGANVVAGGDASLTAGRHVVLDTVEDTSITQTHFNGAETTTSVTKQIGSTLSSGGNLTVSAKKNITVAGSDLKAGGNAELDAGKNVKILARDDSTQVVSKETKKGFGVGGGLWGKETTTTDHLTTVVSGSTISADKNVSISAGKKVTTQGAKLNAKGDMAIAATDVNVLEARNTDTKTTHKETVSILSLSRGEGNTKSSSTDSSADTSGKVEASAEASATHDAGGIDFMKTTTTDSMEKSTTAVASQLNAGQNLTITGKKDVVLRGAEVSAGGDASLSGQNVGILAAQDTHVVTSKTTTAKVGLYANTTNSANADATAGAGANVSTGSASVSAGATAVANAKSSTSIDFLRTKTTEDTTVDISNKGTTLASGGSLTINSKKDLVVQGSELSGETGVDITAKNMSFLAAEDSHMSTSSTSMTSSGLYIDGNAKAKAQATASANAGLGVNAGVSASVSGKAELSVGVQHKSSSTTDTEGSTTARVSSITSGSGSISRTAENRITDVGTAIEAGGDYSQKAKTYDSKAAANTSYKTSTSSSDVAKAGVYAKAEAGVTASAGVSAGLGLDGQPKAEAGAGVQASANVGAGIKTSYSRDASESSSASSEAVVTTIKAGGKLTSVTSGKTSMEGTQLSGGEGVTIEAKSLDFKAAENTKTSSSSVSNVNGAVSAGLTRGSGKGFEASVSGGTSKTDTSESSSTAVVGSINSGGSISIKTKGDTRLEGTNLSAEGNAGIEAGGSITFDAARDTASSSKTTHDASASLHVGDSAGGGSSKSSVDAKVAGGYSKETASSSTARAGSIKSGGKLDMTAGKTVTLEGTNMEAGGDATISGTEGVSFNAAHSTSESKSTSVRAGVGVGTSKTSDAQGTSGSKSANVTAEVGYSKAKESTAAAGSLSSGGNLAIKSGKDVSLEGTELSAKNKASINAGGDVNFKAAESVYESTAVGVALSVSSSKEDKTPKATPQPPAAKTGTGGTQGSDGSAQSNKDLATWQGKHGTVMEQLKAKQASDAGAANQQTPTTPIVPTNAQAPDANVPTTETRQSVATGIQFRKKDKTDQQAGGISAGAGGIEINASGGDVNLVGTNMSTTGDAEVKAKDDVNITATKNTDSSVGITIAVSADKKTEKPTTPPSSGAKAKPGTTGTTGAPSKTSAPPSSATTKQTGATAKPGATGTTGAPSKTSTPPSSTTTKQTGATAKPGATGTTGAPSKTSAPPSSATTKQTGATAKPGATGTTGAPSKTSTPPSSTTTKQAGATAKPGATGTTGAPSKTSAPPSSATTKQTGATAKPGATGTTGAPSKTSAPPSSATTKQTGATAKPGATGTTGAPSKTSAPPSSATTKQTGATAKPGTTGTTGAPSKTSTPPSSATTKQTGATAKPGATGTTGAPSKTSAPPSSATTKQAGATAKPGTTGTTGAPSKTSTPPSSATTKQTGATAKPGTTGTTGAPSKTAAPPSSATTKQTGATAKPGATGTTGAPSKTSAPPSSATTKQAGATAKPGATGTTGAPSKTSTPPSSTTTKQTGATAKPGATGTTGAPSKTATTPPASMATQAINNGLSIGTTGVNPSTSSEWKVDSGVSKTTAEDPDNTSSAYVGVGGGMSTQNQGASISADGTVKITSGGKTTLVNTNIEAGAGADINAEGGVDRKTVKDTTLLNVDTNSGPASVNEGVSAVPMYDQSNGGAATTPGTAPATGVVPPVSRMNMQNGGAVPPKP